MKLKLLKVTVVASALSFNALGGILTYGDYSHDSDTNIVVGDGLEWLKWSTTGNMTYSQALDYASSNYGDGWALATSDQISGLIENFDFGLSWDPLSPSEVSASSESAGSDSNNNYVNAPYYNFVSMFGDTYIGHEGNLYSDWTRLGSRAIFGTIDSTNVTNILSVWSLRNISNFDCCNFKDSADILLDRDYLSKSYQYRDSYGVALTRVSNAPPLSTPVTSPSTIVLFTLGVMFMVSRQLKKSS